MANESKPGETKPADARLPQAGEVAGLKEAVRDARIEAAERSGVVVDLRDAEAARLELLNEQLDMLFSEIPNDVDLFDRGITKGDVPKLWIDVIAHVEMGRDKRIYRFVQDSRYGRKVLAESYEVRDLADAITRYVARRLVERERALADDSAANPLKDAPRSISIKRGRGRPWLAFLLGLLCGVAALFVLAYFNLPRP